MGRNFVSAFRQELTNLDKDPDSHKTTMSNLRSIVKDLDAKVIHVFVAQLSEKKEIGSESGGYTVSLFEDLARAHGVKIAPHVERIMPVIIRTLSSSEGSLRVQQACSKAVAAIARYGIDPATPEDKKRNVIRSLCKPLSDSLLDSQHQQHLALGSALCLKSLVDCDNWRFATDEMVNNVCQSLAVALEATSSEANSHMALVMALAKHNSFIVEAYARLFVKSGLRILDLGVVEGDSRKRFIAIQMLNFLIKNLDPKSICSELELIFQEVEKHQKDETYYVKMAAYVTMITAERLRGEPDQVFDAEKCKTRNSCSGSTESTPSLADMGNDLDNNLWWDIENCLVPTDCPPDLVCAKISKKLFDEGFTGPVNKIKVIAANSSSVPKRILDGIRDKVDYTEYNTVENDFADVKIKQDLEEWMASNPAPQNVLLITRDNGYVETFKKLQARGYTTLNVYVTSGTNELKAIPYLTKAWEMRSFLDLGPFKRKGLARRVAKYGPAGRPTIVGKKKIRAKEEGRKAEEEMKTQVEQTEEEAAEAAMAAAKKREEERVRQAEVAAKKRAKRVRQKASREERQAEEERKRQAEEERKRQAEEKWKRQTPEERKREAEEERERQVEEATKKREEERVRQAEEASKKREKRKRKKAAKNQRNIRRAT